MTVLLKNKYILVNFYKSNWSKSNWKISSVKVITYKWNSDVYDKKSPNIHLELSKYGTLWNMNFFCGHVLKIHNEMKITGIN